jgi:hypothetical protein
MTLILTKDQAGIWILFTQRFQSWDWQFAQKQERLRVINWVGSAADIDEIE